MKLACRARAIELELHSSLAPHRAEAARVLISTVPASKVRLSERNLVEVTSIDFLLLITVQILLTDGRRVFACGTR
jgi:hypothetical protein